MQLSLAIVGADHPNKRGPARRFALALLRPGDALELIPEPKNPADPYAVAVFTAEGVQIGYVTAERAPWIGKMLAQGRELTAVFQVATAFGGWARVAFDGETPVIPTPSKQVRVEEDTEFWPDPEPPDF